MKKSLFALLVSLFSIQGFALYNGNPILMEMVDEGFFAKKNAPLFVSLGYQRDDISNLPLKPTSPFMEKVDRFEVMSDQANLLLSFLDQYQIYTSLGVGSITLQGEAKENRGYSKRQAVSIDSKEGHLFGIGGRAIIFDWNKGYFGMDIKYHYFHPRITSFLLEGELCPLKREPFFPFHHFQIGGSLGYKIDILFPYIGIALSHLKGGVRKMPFALEKNRSLRFKNKRSVTPFIGVSLTTGRYLSCSMESRFLGERGLTLASTIKF